MVFFKMAAARTACGLAAAVLSFSCAAGDIEFANKAFRLVVGEDASVKSLKLAANGEECVEAREGTPFFTVTQDRPFNNEIKLAHMNKRTTYRANRIRKEGKNLVVGFELAPYEAVVSVNVKPSYMEFKLERFIVDPEDYGDLKMDTPPVASFRVLQVPVRNRENFGDWINAMWDGKCAVGVISTACETDIDNEARHGFTLLTADLVRARRLCGGSAVLVAAPGPDAFLDAVERVEEDFSLPHGVRSRRSPLINASMFWISDMTPNNVDRYIDLAKQAGVRMMLLYYTCIVKETSSWGYNGDWDILPAYTNGLSDVAAMLAKIKAAGITPGLHFLHSHVGLKSRYVTPVADHRLNLTRRFTLARPLADGEDELFVEENPIDTVMHKGCRLLRFGGELISYEGYTTEPPYRFTGIKRGAWETRKVSHPMGEIGGILDVSEFWEPKSCYVDERTSLQDEIADKIASVYSAGFEFAYFDGSEGVNEPFNYNVPYAQYRVWKKLNPEPIFGEAAAKAHFDWHMLAGANAFDIFAPEVFKAKIVEFPFAEAPLMRKNFTRLNFGWWKLYKPEAKGAAKTIGTQPDMWEFGTSRAAAWDCPMTVQMTAAYTNPHPRLADLLETIRRWEDVRAKGWLTKEHKDALKSSTQEHHLYLNEKGEYELHGIELLPVSKDAPHLRGFVFERNGRRVVAYWHTCGEAAFSVPLSCGDRPCRLDAAGIKYLETELSVEKVKAAFLMTKPVFR